MADQQRIVRKCRCRYCQQSSRGEIAQVHQAINRVLVSLNERGRRLFVGLLAHERGRGGVVEVATITGMSRTTIRRGMLEIQRVIPESSDRVRRPGGGRKRIEKKTRSDPGTPTSRCRRYGRRSDHRVAVDSQDDPEAGSGVEPTWVPGKPHNRRTSAAAG